MEAVVTRHTLSSLTYDEPCGIEISLVHGGGMPIRATWDILWRLTHSLLRRVRENYCEAVDCIQIKLEVAGPGLPNVEVGCHGVRWNKSRNSISAHLGISLPRARQPEGLMRLWLAEEFTRTLEAIITRIEREPVLFDSDQLRKDWEGARSLFISSIDLGWETPMLPASCYEYAGEPDVFFIPIPEIEPLN